MYRFDRENGFPRIAHAGQAVHGDPLLISHMLHGRGIECICENQLIVSGRSMWYEEQQEENESPIS